MNRTFFWSIFGALALMILGAAWFFAHFDRVPSTKWEKPGKEALRNPYLALERFTARLGRPLARVSNALALDLLSPGGVLLLDDSRRIHVNPKRADALFEWVSRGGYLIVAAEGESVDDPVLDRLGVTGYEAPEEQHGSGEEQAGKTAGDNPEATAGQCTPPSAEAERGEPDTIPVRLPGRDKPLYLERAEAGGLQPGDPAPVWRAGVDDRRNTLLHYAYGRGQITVLDDFGFLTNRSIGEYDHAELIWELVRYYQPEGELRLATRLEVPTLWEWLAESAWTVLVSGGFLIAAWLWAIVPRFGGVLPVTEPARRSLAEHLSAIGRAVWREGGLVHWSNVVRQEMWENLVRRHPPIPQLPEPERIETLARLGGVPPERLAAVLNPEDDISPEAFAEMARTVQQLEQKL
jgi:hypothetical protein